MSPAPPQRIFVTERGGDERVCQNLLRDEVGGGESSKYILLLAEPLTHITLLGGRGQKYSLDNNSLHNAYVFPHWEGPIQLPYESAHLE